MRGPKPRPDEERFWPKVDKDGPISPLRPELGPCWIWLAGRRGEYGGFAYADDKNGYAHRYAYLLLRGEIPPKHDLDHLCRNVQCVNPYHLEAVTHKENMQRGARGRLVTHCPQGHDYTPETTVLENGRRKCRICLRARSCANRARRKAAG